MGLILKDNKYLKIDIYGNYIIYKNKTSRVKEKQATNPELILKKYDEIINETSSWEYVRYHEKTGLEKQWIIEYNEYHYNLINHIMGGKYPLMAEYFPDIEDTISEIITRGQLPLRTKTLKEMYNKIKDLNLFEEAKNA